MKPNQEVELSNSKGELVASIWALDNQTVEIALWDTPKGPGQGGNTHFALSENSLTLFSTQRKSQIVFSFSDDDEPSIKLMKYGKVVWSSSDEE